MPNRAINLQQSLKDIIRNHKKMNVEEHKLNTTRKFVFGSAATLRFQKQT
jgi:hypothetical protein